MKKTFKIALAAVLALTASMSVAAIKTSELKWIPMKGFPVYGTLAKSDSIAYVRLPDSLCTQVRPDLYALGKNTAGMYIRFASDASAIGAKWKSLNKFDMNHMTAAGIRGLDLYTLENGKWTTLSSARPSFFRHNTTTMMMTDMTPKMREYMLYLPLYDGVDSIYIGVDSAAQVVMPKLDSPRAGKPVIMYGTSILQGGCASRPGMVHTSILGRELDREVVNLGFSGNARLDPEIARMIAASDPSLVVLDALPNCTSKMLEERLANFVGIIRKAHPKVPILLVESAIFPSMRFNNEMLETITKKNETLRGIYDSLKATGDQNLYYFEGKDVLGDCVEGTVDNAHFTDLGFTVYARNLLPVMKMLME